MAWTTPRTWVTSEVVTAAIMNAHVRDNFNETSAATVTTAGDIVYADAANSMGSRLAIGGAGSLLGSTGSVPVWRQVVAGFGNATVITSQITSYGPLDGLSGEGWEGASVTATTTTGTHAIVILGARLSNNTGGALTYLSFSVSGATTLAASDQRALFYESGSANDAITASHVYVAAAATTMLTAGSNTFTLRGRVSAGTGSLQNTRLSVIPF